MGDVTNPQERRVRLGLRQPASTALTPNGLRATARRTARQRAKDRLPTKRRVSVVCPRSRHDPWRCPHPSPTLRRDLDHVPVGNQL